MPNGIVAHAPDGVFDVEALKREAAALLSMAGLDLVPGVTTGQSFGWDETTWRLGEGYGHAGRARVPRRRDRLRHQAQHPAAPRRPGLPVTVLPATASAEEVLSRKPDGVFLSNGPGDPAATGEYAVPTIRRSSRRACRPSASASATRCSASRSAATTEKMRQGHHGANHPVKDFTTGKVEIVSMNHGFALDNATACPKNVEETHVSLFDGSNCGIRMKDKPVFSVQYHPEASPGPQDSHYLFKRFVELMREKKAG